MNIKAASNILRTIEYLLHIVSLEYPKLLLRCKKKKVEINILTQISKVNLNLRMYELHKELFVFS